MAAGHRDALDRPPLAALRREMDFDEAEQALLRDLVKAARQRTQHIKWVDRDGTQRLSALNAAEAAQVADIGRKLKIAPAEVLRRAAHIPVTR